MSSIEICELRGRKGHVGAQSLRSALIQFHPLTKIVQGLFGVECFLGKCCKKGGRSIHDDEYNIAVLSHLDFSMVDKDKVTKVVSTQA